MRGGTGPRRRKSDDFYKSATKTIGKGRGRGVFGSHRRERIAFAAKYGDVRLGRSKVEPGRNKIERFEKTS